MNRCLGVILAVSFLGYAPVDREVAYSGRPGGQAGKDAPAPVPAPVPVTSPGEFESPWKDESRALVIDPYWMNSIDWDRMATDGRVAGVIHKATQGKAVDKLYESRRNEAKRRGYLWGSYHLATPGDPVGQADFYLETVTPGEDEVIALDLEGLDPCKFMSIGDARRFIERIVERTGRYPLLYANNSVVREIVRDYGPDSVFARCPLWFARPGTVLSGFPKGFWRTYALWQFSSEQNCKPAGKGDCLYRVAGTRSDMDVNVFFGTVDELRARWPFRVEGQRG